MKYLPVFLIVLLLSGCGDDPYRSFYDGIKNRNDATKTPTERARSPTPSYDEFKKERDQQ